MEEEQQPWYAIRTFNCQEQKVSRFLSEKEYVNFIPMTYAEERNESGTPKRVIVPAIHNLLFVQKKSSRKELVKDMRECSVPLSIFQHPGEHEFCEITANDMEEFRMLCDPQYKSTVYMTQTEAEAMIGKEVRVVKGPFKGSVGKLVRKNKQYYFLKAIIGMGVMVRVSRWYCEPLENH